GRVGSGGEPGDESEVDGDGDHFEAVAAGADDHFALQVEAVAAQAHLEQQLRRIEAKAALRVGDVRLRAAGNGPGGEAVGHPPPRKHLVEEVCAAADDQVCPGLGTRGQELRNLARQVLAVGVEGEHRV